MRAWLLILAVLATLQITTQVASTEEQQQVLRNRKNNKNQNQESSSLSPLSSSSSSYSLPVIVDTSTSKLSDSLSDHSINNDKPTADSEADADTDTDAAASASAAPEEEEDEDSLSHHQEKLTLKPDTDTLVKVQNTLLSAFGLKRRPKNLDRSKIVIPEAMKKLYAEIMGQELDSINIPKPGLHTKTANTVRSFTHQGEFTFISFVFWELGRNGIFGGRD